MSESICSWEPNACRRVRSRPGLEETETALIFGFVKGKLTSFASDAFTPFEVAFWSSLTTTPFVTLAVCDHHFDKGEAPPVVRETTANEFRGGTHLGQNQSPTGIESSDGFKQPK